MIDTVEQIMTKDIFKIDVSNYLPKAKEIFDKNKIKHLPVVSGKKLIGMINKDDIMRLSFGDTYETDEDDVDAGLFNMLSIEDVMTRNTKIVSPYDTINKVAKTLLATEFQAFPVLDDGKLVGIITSSDIINHLLSKFQVDDAPTKFIEQRPWGNFEQYCLNTPCTVKIINIHPDEEISMQYHENRNEFFRVIQGEGEVIVDGEKNVVTQDDEFIIPAKSRYKIKAAGDLLQMLKITFGYFDKNDLIKVSEGLNQENETVLQ